MLIQHARKILHYYFGEIIYCLSITLVQTEKLFRFAG